MSIRQKMKNFFKSERANIALAFGLTLPVAVGLIGSGLDYAQASKHQRKLQAIADSAAIAGAREVL